MSSPTFESFTGAPGGAPEIPRDRWGRPLIKPVGGGRAVGYTRASSLGKTLEDQTTLTQWKLRQVVIGMASRPDLVALAAAKKSNTKEINKVADDAKEYALASAAANTGTAVHGFIEAIAKGEEVGPVPAHLQPDIDAYKVAMAEWKTVTAEQFVVCDELQVAGTFDMMLERPRRLRGGLVVGDLKTGANAVKYGQGEIAVQLAIYAHGKLYDPATGKRGDLGCSLTDAYVIHLPVGGGKADIYRVDIARGWEAAKLAVKAREWRKAKDLFIKVEEINLVDIDKAIGKAATIDEVRATYTTLVRAGNDKAKVEAACRGRIAELEAAA